MLPLTRTFSARSSSDEFQLQMRTPSQHAGFRKWCVDYIFILRQIHEQLAEWNGTIYANFIDFEKAFDSLHRGTLWKIIRSYGIPQKMVNIITFLYRDFECKVICNNQLTDSFSITTWVKQYCILSPFLFTVAMDWLMKVTTPDSRIRWTLTTYPEDQDYADYISLRSMRQRDMQEK